MPFSHSGLQTTTGIYRCTAVKLSQVNEYTLSYRFLNGSVRGCVLAKNRPVSLNWSDYSCSKEILPEEGLSVIILTDKCAVLAAMVSSLVCAFVVRLQQNQVFLH